MDKPVFWDKEILPSYNCSTDPTVTKRTLVPFSLGRGIRQPQTQVFEGLCATKVYPFNSLLLPTKHTL